MSLYRRNENIDVKRRIKNIDVYRCIKKGSYETPISNDRKQHKMLDNTTDWTGISGYYFHMDMEGGPTLDILRI